MKTEPVSHAGSRCGEETARHALSLAFVLLICCCFVGCGTPKKRPNIQRRVNYSALLQTHPLWQQVTRLDDMMATFGREGARDDRASLDWPAMESPLVGPPQIPPTMAAVQERRVQEYDREYLHQLEQTMERQDTGYLDRLSKRLSNEAESRYQTELARRISEIRLERSKVAGELGRQETRLKFRDVPLQVQARVYRDQQAQDASVQHEQLRSQIEALENQIEELLSPSVISDLATKSLAGRRETLLSESRAEYRAEEKRLSSRRSERLQQEQGKLTYVAESIPSISRVVLPAARLIENGAISSASKRERQKLADATYLVQQAKATAGEQWRTERQRIVMQIQQDIERAVKAVGTENGWEIMPDVANGRRGAPDVTEAVRLRLLKDWRVHE